MWSPLTHSPNLNGPVPIGLVDVGRGALRRDDHRIAPAHVVEEIALRLGERDLDGGGIDDVDRGDVGEELLLGARANSAARSRSSENLTSSAVNGVPSWNLTPVLQVEGVGQPVGRDVPGLVARSGCTAPSSSIGSGPRRCWRRSPRGWPPRRRRWSDRGWAARAACR